MDSDYAHQEGDYQEGPHPHPYIHEPLLYITNLPSFVTDEMLAVAFMYCGPFRPKIQRDAPGAILSGTIEFKFLEKAEKALATLQGRPIPEIAQNILLVLSPYPSTNPPTPLPPPSALPRLVKQLPPGYGDSQLYDLFRPYGALASARVQTHFGPDTGMIEFWNESDARAAEEALHCAEVDGQNIAVQVYHQPRRTSASFAEFNPSAAAFVPSGSSFFTPYPNQYSPHSPHSPPRGSPYHSRSPLPGSPYHNKSPLPGSPTPFHPGPGQQIQYAPSNSHSGLIDPCNLFCKNLDPDIDSNKLFTHFRRFGQIVSARVMRNESGDSRGFGFVSYQTPEQANAALHAMNGAQLGSKQIVVRLHEPKQMRQEKLAQRFGGNGHPRSASGATSPTISEAGDGYTTWGSPRARSATLVGTTGYNSPGPKYDRPDRNRRGSGSYYNAALAGTLNLPMKYDELAALTPVVRKEVLSGELSRRIQTMDIVGSDELGDIVDSLSNLALSDVISTLDNPDKLKEQIELRRKIAPASKESSRPVSVSQISSTSDLNAANNTASAPEHPSTPISVSATLSTPPRTSSPAGSIAPMSERERMFAAVSKFENARQEELTDLMMGLPKRERAMCLFNLEVLRVKLVDAKAILESDDEEEQTPISPPVVPPKPSVVPATPQSMKTVPRVDVPSPQTPVQSSRGTPAGASPAPATPGGGHTIASLAKLPAAEIIRMANSSSSTGLPLPKSDPLVIQATDEFIDGLLDQTVLVQKQKLGDKLYKVVKSFGIKAAPKVTIYLLDQEDLRALAHLMNSYPAVLKEKALNVTVR
ncbi:hypothetical protein DFP72DRAFT_417605 [Ephemerocybe angulata]|uniref:RRM domain-containing protein n=1 Tax=Ephemerocybe angulata TaxID=980116 RepID=A0A8H6IES2_9AGAR|nr:hypothetical protein DFP72DRAFT_417605 [Tulosesus angulatus]